MSDVSEASDDWVARKTRLSSRHHASAVRVALMRKMDSIKKTWAKEALQETLQGESQDNSTETSVELIHDVSRDAPDAPPCPRMEIGFLVS